MFPVYVISKGRFENCLTAKFLIEDKVDFSLVVEPQEYEQYRAKFPDTKILVLPFSNLGLGSIPARNWCWEHSIENGAARHWILDDNIRWICQRYKAQRLRCRARIAFTAAEDFTERYENIGISGLAYTMFVPDRQKQPPFWLNVHVYSCLLIRNDIQCRWRGRYNEDTDLCLQTLALGWCTVLFNAFMINKMPTMTMKGGNSDELYKGDGRLRMARALERKWPGVVKVDRRFQRPQHVVKNQWRWADTQLIPKKNIKFKEYKTKITEIVPVRSEYLKKLISDA